MRTRPDASAGYVLSEWGQIRPSPWGQMGLTRPSAVRAPSFGWEATVGVLAVVLTGTACLLAVLRWFSHLTPKQHHDVIALIRVWRGTGRPGRPDEAPPDAPADW